jgi:bifunctional non-homologous end joining protein LigD
VSLADYRRKRQFNQTPEPAGREHGTGRELRFVVQKHHATRLHYDFRLELDGVLKSWAVPKGPSLNPADKRLAVQVEDHPLEYRTFEGTIPAGNYGAGEVIVWDEGTYQHAGSERGKAVEDALRRELEAGRLRFVLDGHKLKGEFSLVRIRGKGARDEKNWLLIKKDDDWAETRDITEDIRSVRSDRTLGDDRGSTGSANAKAKRGNPGAARRASAAHSAMPRDVKPMLSTLVAEPFDRPGWLFEIKWDGYRAIAEVEGQRVRLYSRNLTTFNEHYPPIVDSLKRLGHDAVLDGEIVALDEAGRSQFETLQNYRRTGKGRLVYYVFDLLYLDGRDLRKEPLHARRDQLASILGDLPNVKMSESIETRGIDFFRSAIEHGLEGIIAKDPESPYREGRRSGEWLKIKTHNRQEAVIGGFTAPRGSRKDLGALVLGVYDGPDLVYIGHTGGGFDEAELARLRGILDPLIQEKCPFRERPKVNSPVKWVTPKLVCEVRFQEWTSDGRMRQPVYLGLREDKPARSVHRELAKPVQREGKSSMTARARPRRSAARTRKAQEPDRPEPNLTNLDKVYWPDEGYTKGDLIAYYRDMAPVILSYLRDRPMALNRHPNGIKGKNFFQKDVSRQPPPEWVRTVEIPSESRGRMATYIVCQDAATLLYVANLGCVEINPWHSRVESLDNPDYLVLDLDPVDVPFEQVIEVAVVVRKTLEKAEVESVIKTSGKRGMHVCIPLAARYSYDEARQFAELLARLVHEQLPDTTSLVRDPRKRQGKVYLDFLQNGPGQTVVAPYSVRPYPGATVSTPLDWKEVRKALDPGKFTIRTMARRLDRVGDLWQPVLGPGIDLQRIIEGLRLRTSRK